MGREENRRPKNWIRIKTPRPEPPESEIARTRAEIQDPRFQELLEMARSLEQEPPADLLEMFLKCAESLYPGEPLSIEAYKDFIAEWVKSAFNSSLRHGLHVDYAELAVMNVFQDILYNPHYYDRLAEGVTLDLRMYIHNRIKAEVNAVKEKYQL